MNTLICEAPGKFAYGNRERPAPSEDHVTLRVRHIGICGTDLHAFEGTQPYFTYPRVLGHELACEIVEGDIPAGFQVGGQVTVVPYKACGKCIACQNGKPNCCTDVKVLGVHVDGGMTEFISVPSHLLVKGGGIPFEQLALVEPFAIGAHAVKRANIRPGEYVLVVGAGPIGLGIMELAMISGARVIALDFNKNRLAFCRNVLDVHHAVDAAENPMGTIKEITHGDGASVVFDATGSAKAIMAGFGYMAHGARYVLVGLQKGEISFSHPEFHKRESVLMSSRNALREDFEWVAGLMRQNKLKAPDYITHKVGFGGLKDAFPSWLDPQEGVIKALVVCGND